jgi:FAD/FMN-containing dehydrogenase
MKTLTTEFVSGGTIKQQNGSDKPSAAGPDNALLLAQELRQSISGEVRFDSGSRALYSTDSSNYRQIPIGVVVPKSREDVINIVKICSRHGAPITGRGGGQVA